jgi:sugar (pentulose or hexulose) kinase
VSNSSALGGALRAAAAVEGAAWEDLFARFCAPDTARAVEPDPTTRAVYAELGAQLERRVEELVTAGLPA